jgi:hypothetical protein
MSDLLYDGTPVTVDDEESHQGDVMFHITGPRIDGWVYEDDENLEELPQTPENAVALDEGVPPQ